MSRWQERTFTVHRDGGDVTLDVSFSYIAGSAPRVSGPPEYCDPGEPPTIDVLDVSVVESDDPAFIVGTAFKLTDEEEQAFFDDVIENTDSDDDGPDPDDARDDRDDPDFNYYGD